MPKVENHRIKEDGDRPQAGICMDQRGWVDRAGGMKRCVVVELVALNGSAQVHGGGSGGNTTAACSVKTPGLTPANAKRAPLGLQRRLIQAQVDEHCRGWPRCRRRVACCPLTDCGTRRPLRRIV